MSKITPLFRLSPKLSIDVTEIATLRIVDIYEIGHSDPAVWLEVRMKDGKEYQSEPDSDAFEIKRDIEALRTHLAVQPAASGPKAPLLRLNPTVSIDVTQISSLLLHDEPWNGGKPPGWRQREGRIAWLEVFMKDGTKYETDFADDPFAIRSEIEALRLHLSVQP